MAYLNQIHGVDIIEAEDTAASARLVREGNLTGVAAIASERAAQMYKLEIIARQIETYKKNYTRFLVLAEEKKANKDGNKVSICFATGHQPGSLATVLVKLAEIDINLSKIQSVPRHDHEWEYIFYLDLELQSDHDIDLVTNLLENYTSNLEVLGIYNKGMSLYES